MSDRKHDNGSKDSAPGFHSAHFLVEQTNCRQPAARISAAWHSKGSGRRVIRIGRLVVDPDARLATIDERPLHLTGKEYAILELLSLHKGTILTREMLLDHLYCGTYEPGMKIIDVFVCKLRRKIAQSNGGKHHIETVWGRGYMLNDPPDDEPLPPVSLTGL